MREAIFIPGLLCTQALFSHQISALSDRLNIAVADHRRHSTVADIAASVLADAPERFTLAGLSMGGYVCFEIMRQAGERVEALILFDTTARPDPPEQSERRRSLMALAREEGIGPVIEQMLPLFIPEHRMSDEHLTGALRDMAETTGVDAFIRQQQAIIQRVDSRPTLAEIDCPTLMIVGEEDILTPPELAREIVAGIDGARLETIPGCGHISTLEKPDAVNEFIAGFLDERGLAA